MPVVSVIIPVYNVELYLDECLESVCNQTLKDIEIICINDGSTDRSLQILQKYEKQDERIIIIDQENHGLPYTRNTGIQKAAGRYIYFLDSDDYIAYDALEILVATMEANDLEILFFNAKVFGDTNVEDERIKAETDYFKRVHKYPEVCKGEDLYRLLQENKEFVAPVSTYLIKRDFIIENKFIFAEGIIHEDELYTFQCLTVATRTGYMGKELYYRRVRENSIMDFRTRPEKMILSVFSYFVCVKQMLSFCNSVEFREENEDAIFSRIEGMVNLCRNRYGALNETARDEVLKMTGKDKILFKALILTSFNNNERIKKLKTEIKNKTARLEKEKKNALTKVTRLEKNNKDALAKVSLLQKKTEKLNNELHNVKNGWSFRLGRAITWIPRKIRGGIRCWQEHGFLYTLKRCGEKLHIVQKGPGRANLDKRRKLFLFSTPWHGNLGDHAILLGEYELLKKMFPSNEIIEIPTKVCANLMNDGNNSSEKDLCIGKKDIVFIQGGGNLGDIWVNEERVHRWIIQKFAHNKIVFMPQSIFFHNHESGMAELKKSREAYAKADDLTLLTRDNVSYEFAKKNFVKAKVVLVPDAATYLEGRFPETAVKREGVCFFLRKDKEKVSSDELLMTIREYLRRRGVPYEISDTVIANNSLKTNELRRKAINDTLLQARKSRLVITDRFHGVIFSVITHTPVIAFKSYDTKISSGIRWFKELDWVHYAENMEPEEIERLIDKYCLQGEVSVNRFTGCPDILEKEFRKLL